MGVDADLAVVVILAVWAPDCLEVEHVEVHVDRILLNELDGEFRLAMREGAEFLIVAFCILDGIKIRGAELGFVLIRMIEFFDSVMSFVTAITGRAVLYTFLVN